MRVVDSVSEVCDGEVEVDAKNAVVYRTAGARTVADQIEGEGSDASRMYIVAELACGVEAAAEFACSSA